MATLTIKNFPPEAYEELKQRAKENRRSINSQAILCLLLGLRRRAEPLDREAFLARLEARRSRFPVVPLTDEFLREAKDNGRP